MSFSFNTTKPTKLEAIEDLAAQFQKMLEYQPSHKADQDPVFAILDTYMNLLTEQPEGMHVSAAINGSLSWREEGKWTWAGVGCTVGYVTPTVV